MAMRIDAAALALSPQKEPTSWGRVLHPVALIFSARRTDSNSIPIVPESSHQEPGSPRLYPRPAIPMVVEAPIIVAQKVPVRAIVPWFLPARWKSASPFNRWRQVPMIKMASI